MTITMTVSEARAALPELLNRVVAGDEVTITRHGEPVAVVVHPDALRVRRAERADAAAGRIRDLLAKSRDVPLPAEGGLSQARATELLDDVRDSRSDRS